MKKILIGLLVTVVIIVIGFTLMINLTWQKDHSSTYPVNQELVINADSAMIARGKYLVYGPAHCAHCHVPFEKLADVENGMEVSLTGGFGLEIPPGKFIAPNITMDAETGIGNKSDGELYRMLRHNVRTNGMPSIDFMPFINMSERDIYAIIAYLRTTEPVKSKVINTKYSFLGKALLALGVIKPGDPDQPVPKHVEKEASAEYGEYLAYAVANCRGCHTERDMSTGQYTGPFYAGGLLFGPDNLTNGWQFVSPNLTPDPETGILFGWTEEQFIARMKSGRVYESSPMPWAALTQMDTVELQALYRYFTNLTPISNKITATVIAPE